MGLAPVEGLVTLTDVECLALRDRLRAQGFGPGILAFGEQIAGSMMFDTLRLPVVCWALVKRGDAASVLARLFLYADTVESDATRTVFGDALFERALATSILVVASGDRVRGGFRIVPVGDLLFLADDLEQGAEAVMPPGPTTVQLIEALPSKLTGSMLDVGTGPGTLAIVAAHAGATRVVGVDISERAITQARFNARLNGLQVEFAVGDLVAPVKGSRFDLIVAQPPYVVRPGDTGSVTFLHGGAMGDEIAMRLLSGVKTVLAPGGRAYVLFDSPVRPSEPLVQRVRTALGAPGLDLAVLMGRSPDPDVLSVHYAALEAPTLGEGFAEACLRYRTHLDRLGVQEFTHALVLIRAPSVSTPQREGISVALPVPSLPRGYGATIDRLWLSLDLAASSDAVLLRAAVSTQDGARWVEERTTVDATETPTYSVRFAPHSIATDREVTEAGYALFGLMDASGNVAEVIEGYAALCETTAMEVRAQVLNFTREGLARGLLRPRTP